MKNQVAAVTFLSLLISVLLASPSSHGQKQKPIDQSDDDVIRVSTSVVTVPVGVMDRQGRFVPDLKAEHFHLYEDGVEQNIAFFESAEKPFTVALLLDTSDSTRFKLKDIQDAAVAFIDQLRPDDRVMVAAFDKSTSMLVEATNDRRALESGIRRAQTGGGTGLYNAIDVIIKQRLSQIRGRKAIVLFTDGVDTGTMGPTYESSLRLGEELDALVYSIQYNTYDDTARKALDMNGQAVTSKGEFLNVAYARAERYLRLLSDKTGGRFYFAENVKRLREVFTTIAKELREQYSLGYYPKSGKMDAARKINVKVSVPHVDVRARRGYVYKAPAR